MQVKADGVTDYVQMISFEFLSLFLLKMTVFININYWIYSDDDSVY